MGKMTIQMRTTVIQNFRKSFLDFWSILGILMKSDFYKILGENSRHCMGPTVQILSKLDGIKWGKLLF